MELCQLPALPDPFFNQVIVLPAKLPQPPDLIRIGKVGILVEAASEVVDVMVCRLQRWLPSTLTTRRRT